MSAAALNWFTSDTVHFCVHPYYICGEASAHLYGEEQSFQKPLKGRALFPSLCAFFLYSDIYIYIYIQGVLQKSRSTLKVNIQHFFEIKLIKHIQHLNECNFDNDHLFPLMNFLRKIIELYI